jgi:hypothetical protein
LASAAALPELPQFKGRPGWEFTDISKLDLAAYDRVEPTVTGGVSPLWELGAAARSCSSRVASSCPSRSR